MKVSKKSLGNGKTKVMVTVMAQDVTDKIDDLSQQYATALGITVEEGSWAHNELIALCGAEDTRKMIDAQIMKDAAEVAITMLGLDIVAKPRFFAEKPATEGQDFSFEAEVFDKPQYGDSQVVVVSSGKTSSVTLECVQINAGVRLKIDPDFLTEYPNGVFFLKSADGKLMYGYSEKRIAYFKPGNVSLVLNENSSDKTVCTRTLAAQEILTLNINVSSSKQDSGAGIHIQVDTTRFWNSETLDLGGDDSGRGQDKSTAFSVAQAKDHVGDTDVWVYGYIVGGDLTSSKCSFEPPFSSRTNIVLATKSTCTDKESCISVQLSNGKIRDALNLVDHEDNLGKKVFLKGDIVPSYYGIVGVQSISEYSF